MKQEIFEQLSKLWAEFEANHKATSKVSDQEQEKL